MLIRENQYVIIYTCKLIYYFCNFCELLKEIDMSDLIKNVSENVAKYLTSLVEQNKDISYDRINSGCFTVKKGSTLVHVLIKEWKEDTPLVECISYVVKDAEMTEDLATKLLLMNWEMPFGSFSIDLEDNCIALSQCLVGSTLDEPELNITVETIAQVADEVDDLIVEEYGGVTALQDLFRKKDF